MQELYACFVTARKINTEHASQWVESGNIVNYPSRCRTPTVNQMTVKLLHNSIISTPNAKFMTLDLKDFYLMTLMKRYKYFCMKLDIFPQDIIDKYNLTSKFDHNGNVHCKVR